MKRLAIVLSIIFGTGRCAFADDAAQLAILDDMQAEVSACVAFYTIDLSCGERRETRSRLAVASKRAYALASAIVMAPADTAMRLDLNLTAFRVLIGNSCSNIATLENRYVVECDPLSSAPN